MAVKQIEFKRNRAGTRFCEKKGCYVGYRIDVRIHGKRYRNNTFPTRGKAESYIASLKLEEKREKRVLKAMKSSGCLPESEKRRFNFLLSKRR